MRLQPHSAACQIPLMTCLRCQAQVQLHLLKAERASPCWGPSLCGAARQLQHSRVQHMSLTCKFSFALRSRQVVACFARHHDRHDQQSEIVAALYWGHLCAGTVAANQLTCGSALTTADL